MRTKRDILAEEFDRAAASWGVPRETVEMAWYLMRESGFRYAKVARTFAVVGVRISRRQLRYFSKRVRLVVDLGERRPKNWAKVLRMKT